MIVYWIALGVQTIVLLLAILGIAIKYSNKIAVLESENKRLDDELKLHCALNEKTFLRLEGEMRRVSDKLSELIGYYKGKTNQELG